MCRAIALLAALALMQACRAENRAEVLELPQVRIVGTTPLPGSGIELRNLPANAQIYTSRDLRRQGAASVTDFLEQNAGGVGINSAQGNRYQPDVNVRGFSASPLLGTPQGISVFFDGVRINEPFGDSVNWDLIPQAAISSIQLIPGSNPAFGLNTLGGAVAIYTKSGASEYPDKPGGNATLTLGSFGRRTLVAETGGRKGPLDWYGTVNETRERGWALHNTSRIRQLFAKVGWQDDQTDLDLTISAARNRLEGLQTVPQSFDDTRQPYTWPDTNSNRLAFIALKGSRALSADWLLSGNAYWRAYCNRNVSSNVNDDFGPSNPVEATNDSSSSSGRSAQTPCFRVRCGPEATRTISTFEAAYPAMPGSTSTAATGSTAHGSSMRASTTCSTAAMPTSGCSAKTSSPDLHAPSMPRIRAANSSSAPGRRAASSSASPIRSIDTLARVTSGTLDNGTRRHGRRTRSPVPRPARRFRTAKENAS